MEQRSFPELCDRARAVVARGDLRKGRQYFERALKLRGDSVEVNYGLGTVCYLLKDLAAATKYFEETLNLSPRHAGAIINLGALCNLRGNYEDAVVYLRRGIQIDPKRSEGFYNLGLAYRKLDKPELAIQAYREAFRLNARMVEAVYNLANIYFDQERYDQAAIYYEKALEVNPKFRKARDGLERTQRFQEEKHKPSSRYDLKALGISVDATVDNDRRLDRLFDPGRDGDFLRRFHEHAGNAERYSDAWQQMAGELDSAIRALSIGLAGQGSKSDFDESLSKFRATVNRFREAGARFAEFIRSIDEYRDKMVERG